LLAPGRLPLNEYCVLGFDNWLDPLTLRGFATGIMRGL
jgi:hypothetical protein